MNGIKTFLPRQYNLWVRCYRLDCRVREWTNRHDASGCQPVGDAAGGYHGIRHSKLNQITADNAAKLTVAWTMSTGTLRGQEGQPLVIANMLYFESSYPNFIYAVDLNNVGRIAWKFAPSRTSLHRPFMLRCGQPRSGLRGRKDPGHDAGYACVRPRRQDRPSDLEGAERRSRAGQTMTMAPLVVHDKVIVGISGGEYGVRSACAASSGQWQNGLAGIQRGAERGYRIGCKAVDGATQSPVGKDSSSKTWEGNEWTLGGGTTWGWYFLTIPI